MLPTDAGRKVTLPAPTAPSDRIGPEPSPNLDDNLSHPTQRRLVGRPLPKTPHPISTNDPPISEHVLCDSSENHPLLWAPGECAELWWPPAALPPTMSTETPPCALDAVCQHHLRLLIDRALRDAAPELAESLHAAVLKALETLAEPSVLAGLQRTACIRWRAEAQLREAASAAASNGSTAISSRWTRLGWPAAALRNIIQPQAGISSVPPTRAPRLSKEQRVRKRDVALAILSNALWLVSSAGSSEYPEDTSEHHGAAVSQMVSKHISHRDHRHAKRAGLPSFISPPLPTTALSASIEITSADQTDASNWSSVEVSRSATPTGRAIEQLASLSASTGDTATAQAHEITDDKKSEASAAEMAALEKAKREFIARVGQGCEERAKMVLAVVCLDVGPTGCDEGSEAQRYGSMLSAKSDRTIGAREGSTGNQTLESHDRDLEPQDHKSYDLGHPPAASVQWHRGRFTGKAVYSMSDKNHLASVHPDAVDEDLKRFRREGGTFVLPAVSQQLADLLHQTLSVALYTAASMLLETALLEDYGLRRQHLPRVRKSPRRAASSVRQQIDPGILPETEPLSPPAPVPTPVLKSTASQRWTKGFWGMFQTSSDAVSSALAGVRQHDKAAMKQLLRVSTDDGSTSSAPQQFSGSSNATSQFRAAAPALPISKGSGRFGRFITSLAQGNARQIKVDADLGSSAQARASIDTGGLAQAQLSSALSEANDDDRAEEDQGEELGRTDSAVPLYSTSPEISASLAQLHAQLQNGQNQIYGLDFLHQFTELQSLSVLVAGEFATGPTTHHGMHTPAGRVIRSTGNYFGSLSSAASSAVSSAASSTLSSSRSVSGASTADSLQQESQPVPTTASVPASSPTQRFHFSRREDVVFYRHVAPGRDLHLGHVIEDLVSRVESVSGADGKLSGAADVMSLPTHTVRYVHDQHQVTISVRTLDDCQHASTSPADTPTSEHPDDVGNGEADVAAVATTLQADQDAARTAVELAEAAIAAAENQGDTEDTRWNATSMWSVDTQTGNSSAPRKMSSQTWLLSFAKYLEALIYHPRLIAFSDSSPYNVARFFQKGRAQIKITLKPVSVYSLQIDGPVVGCQASSQAGRAELLKQSLDKAAEKTRIEIQALYASVKRCIISLQGMYFDRELDEQGRTIASSTSASDLDVSQASSSDKTNTEAWTSSPLNLLSDLNSSFRTEEFALYDTLKYTDSSCLNDVRRMLLQSGKSARQRLSAWRDKHLENVEKQQFANVSLDEPAYARPPYHVFPGSRFVICEDEPLSIIAFSLSSRDYKCETAWSQRHHPDTLDQAPPGLHEKYAQVLNWRATLLERPPPTPTSSKDAGSVSETASTASSVPSSLQERRSASDQPAVGLVTHQNLDLDQRSWQTPPEPIIAAVKRKRRGREASILALTLRRVGSTVSAGSESLRAQPWDVNASLPRVRARNESDDGRDGAAATDFLATSGLDPQTLEIIPSRTKDRKESSTARRSYKSSTISSSSGAHDTFRAYITQVSGRPASLASLFSRETATEDDASTVERSSESVVADKAPTNAIDTQPASASASEASGGGHKTPTPNRPESPHVKHNIFHANTKISCVSWFAEEFAALRERWGIEEDFVESLSSSARWQASGGKSRSTFFKTSDEKWIGKQLLTVWSVDEKDALLEFAPAYIRYMLNSHINDCPSLLVKIAGFYSLKIKDTKTGESRLKMSLMVIENLFADVSAHETMRFDLKGIRDRRASTSKSAPHTLNAQAEAAGLASAAQAPTQPSPRPSFHPLKGSNDGATPRPPQPQGQSTPHTQTASPEVLPVGWDAEWIDMYQQKAFVGESQKQLFTQALRNDLAFLSGSNIMDFSLLVGVTEALSAAAGESALTCPTIRVRIVDYISAFTLAKQLESSSKKALKSSAEARGNVTVLPPAEYAARFESAMLSYFTGVPEGWSHRLRVLEQQRRDRDGQDAADGSRRPTLLSASQQLSNVF